jgi:hypothetical protein
MWTKDSVVLTNSYSAALSLTNVTFVQAGNYLATVTNDLGLAKVLMPLHVVIPPNCNLVQTSAGTLQLVFETQSGLNYFVEEAFDLGGPWQALTNDIVGDGQTVVLGLSTVGNGFYRVRVQ